MSAAQDQVAERGLPEQRIVKIRRDYNTWVADDSLEDYALRFTARAFRKWSEFRVANTAFGAISFLLLEAIGASIMYNYGFTSALWAILAVGCVIFATGVPISYYAARYGVDMDLLTRGAGFGYIGSTVTSLIYASFTFLFFALEATIMALALHLCFGLSMTPAYLVCALVVIPLVTHGISWISRLQAWTQPLWLVMLVLPFVFVIARAPQLLREFPQFGGGDGGHAGFDLLGFGAASTVLMSMVTQIGEQIDFLRFLPEPKPENRRRWLLSVLVAGPGWIVMGAVRLIGGAFLAFVAIRAGVPEARALEPTEMYRVGFGYVFGSPAVALAAMGLFVVMSQLKINVTNAYAGSLAWSNFFARVTHSHPGRVVWVVFNVTIALVLMELDVFHALERVLGLYSNVAISWVGAISADLVINKPLGLSPKGIEFKRAYLYDVNPVGVGAMLVASALSIAAFCGALGPVAQAFSSFIALASAFVTAPAIAWATRGKYYLARRPEAAVQAQRCCICEKSYEGEDMALCPAYRGPICSLCCSLDARCHDVCKPGASLAAQFAAVMQRLLPGRVSVTLNTRLGHYLLLMLLMTGVLGASMWLIYHEAVAMQVTATPELVPLLRGAVWKIFGALFVVGGIGCWWLVLTSESRRVAQEESNRQTHLLMREIEAHRKTDAELQSAKLVAERANQAKSRYITGVSHELRTPLNSIMGYAQIMEHDGSIPQHRRDALGVIRRSGEHLVSLIDGLLDIAKIESGKLTLDAEEVRFPEFLAQIAGMFRLQAHNKGIEFHYREQGALPAVVRVDKKRLNQILINILGNAVKFTDRGSVTLHVHRRGNMALFEVRDTGAGIAPHDLERIFLPFERGSQPGASAPGGTGLGLTIAKMLTNLMGGELLVHSQIGQGSVFEVRLFLPEVREPRSLAAPVPVDIGGYAGPRRRVLVVDDEAVDRRFLVNLLEPIGFDMAEAASGIEALQLAPHIQPDLILLDIGMPGLNGWETARLLRANSVRHVPILIISADHDPGAAIPPRDFIVKPVNVAALLARIRDKLDLAWITRDAAAAQPAPPAAVAQALPQERLRELRDLGTLGHVQGILQKLDEIDLADARYLPFTARLRENIKAFRLSEYMREIEAVQR